MIYDPDESLSIYKTFSDLQVFSGADVKTSLSHEAALFTSANRDFRLLMRASEKNPNVLQCCQRKGEIT